MVRYRLEQVADIVGGERFGPDVEIDGGSIDSRAISTGCLFVPIVAERDGHEFIADAIGRGAAAHLTARRSSAAPTSGSGVIVADTGRALTALGAASRARLPDSVVGITGSVGKTSTKDLTAAALGGAGRTHASPSSFNNELGLPLTLLNAPDDTEMVVLEMGSRGVGHVAELCAVGQPTVGVVTRVALAHGEQFGTIETVTRAKGEMVEALPPSGTAVLNADDPNVAGMADRTSASVLTYGRAGDVRPVDVVLDELLRPRFVVETPRGTADIALGVSGAQMVENATAAVAVAIALDVPLDAAAHALAAASLSSWRMEVLRAPSGAVVINDAYNANPTSVDAALEGLAGLAADRRVAVLGVMAELGDDSPSEHRGVAERAADLDVVVIAVDAPDYGPTAFHVADVDEALDRLGPIGPGDAVLVKASRVAELERLAARLL